MVSLELPQLHNFTMAKNSNSRSKAAIFLSDGFIFAGSAGGVPGLLGPLVFLHRYSHPTSSVLHSRRSRRSRHSELPRERNGSRPALRPVGKEFLRRPGTELHHRLAAGEELGREEKGVAEASPLVRRRRGKQNTNGDRVAGDAVQEPIGDYLLLKLFKNKVDYGRRHGIDVFYNNVLLQPKMFSFWAKTPTVKAAMLAHPEAEWIWWVDSDAAFTDMDFELPLGRYAAHNMVIHGWPNLIYEKKSWTSINAGVFLIRNCQWAMDFMDVWARVGPQHADYDKWGEILRTTFKDKILPESDDQSGLAYLLLKEKEKWGDKIHVENGYYFEGYWVEIVGTFENITEEYRRIEEAERRLRRRHSEGVSRSYGRVWAEQLKDAGSGRRPFITHFTGCQPCSGDHNQMYSGQTCFDAMQKALTFADNQVLRNYGFVHPDIHDPSTVKPLPFDYPA